MKCQKAMPLSALSCSSCDALQPLPASLDAYELLGIDIASIKSNGWDVDLGELKALWRKRVALSHPDRMGGKDHVGEDAIVAATDKKSKDRLISSYDTSQKEQSIAAQQSALINKAYETLREPLQRAHLLVSES
jgi:molecular chaperone HscB